jgi:hypothetical protein
MGRMVTSLSPDRSYAVTPKACVHTRQCLCDQHKRILITLWRRDSRGQWTITACDSRTGRTRTALVVVVVSPMG